MKALFIGHEYDGDVLDVDVNRPEIRLLSKTRIPFAPNANDSTVAFSTISYKREELCDADGTRYFVYMCGDVARPIKLLLDSYHRAAKAGDRLFDILLGDDGQAWKEAEKYLQQDRPHLFARLRDLGAVK